MGSIRRRVKSVFLQQVLCKTFTFEVFRGASKHPSEATFLNASQPKPTLLSPVMKIAELSFAKASEQRFCMEGYAFLYVVSSRYPVGSPGALGSPGPPGLHFGPYLGLSGAIWGYLGLSGAVWGYLWLSGAIWGCLANWRGFAPPPQKPR